MGSGENNIQVIFGLDMETDIGSWTVEYEGVKHGTPKLLELFEDQEVKATFFWVGQTAKENPDMVKRTAQAGHETGAHSLFHETVGESIFPVPGVNPILDSELEGRLRLTGEYIQEACGIYPKSFRSPRLFGGTHVVRTLEKLGYIADASYPLYYYQKQLSPYHPSFDDWTEKGDMNILEIPNFADVTKESHDPYHRDQDQWPLFRTEGAEALMERVNRYLASLQKYGIQDKVLCFYLHPWEFVEMPQGEIFMGEGWVRPDPFLIKNCGDYALDQLHKLIQLLKEQDAQFVTCADLAQAYKKLKFTDSRR